MTSCFCFCTRRKPPQPLILLAFLLLSTTQVCLLVDGRSSIRILQNDERRGHEAAEAVLAGSLIGSRPPSCTRRCASCGKCEAVQVPVMPLNKSGAVPYPVQVQLASSYGRGGFQDISNYKPLSWKCKCGNVILNP